MYDSIKEHLGSLQALGKNVDQPHFGFRIKSRLPKWMEGYKEKWIAVASRRLSSSIFLFTKLGEVKLN